MLIGRNDSRIYKFPLIDDGSTISVIEKGLAKEFRIYGPTMGHYHSRGRMGQFTLKRILRLLLTVIGETGEELTLNIVKTLSELQLPTQSMNVQGMKS